MSKPHRLGLVVGKFSPLHIGHESVIRHAMSMCEQVLVLGYSQPPFAGCGRESRLAWVGRRFPNVLNVQVDDAWLADQCASQAVQLRPMPHNSEVDEDQQEWLSWLLQTVLLCEPDAMFGSEHYLAPTCDRLSRNFGRHVVPYLVDLHREQFAISASRIRDDIHAHRQWLHPDVYRDFVCRVVLLGAESSGKTTLAQALAAEFDTVWVPEYGRQLWEEKDGHLTLDDLETIGSVQVANEEALLGKANGVLFCDTSPLTTLGYAGWMFNAAPESLQLLSQRSYDLTILCSTDFGFIQDGTRQSSEFQRVQQQWYEARMAELATPCVIAHGNLGQRIRQLKPVIDGLLGNSSLRLARSKETP